MNVICGKRKRILSAALLALMVLTAALSGCSELEELVEDYLVVRASAQLTSSPEEDGGDFSYTISADLYNGLPTPVVATVKLDPGAAKLEPLQTATQVVELNGGDSATVFWKVTAAGGENDRNVGYRVTMSAAGLMSVTAQGELFVPGYDNGSRELKFGRDTWRFENYTGKRIPITQDDFNALCYGRTAAERERLLDKVRSAYGGQCYGLASVAALVRAGRLPLSKLGDGASALHDLKKTDTVKSVVAYYYLMQYIDPARSELAAFKLKTEAEKVDLLVDAASRVSQGGCPVLLAFWFENGGGHAVTAYAVEYGSFVRGGKTYTKRVLVYDNNTTEYDEDRCLYADDSGSWTIPHYPSANSIAIVTADAQFMDPTGLEASRRSVDSFLTARGNRDVDVAFGNGAQIVLRGGAMVAGPAGAAAFGMLEDKDDGEMITIAVPRDIGGQTVSVSPARAGETLDVSAEFDGLYLRAACEDAKAAVFTPEGQVIVTGEGKVSLTAAGDDEAGLPWDVVRVEADAQKSVALIPVKEGWVLSGDAKDVRVTAEDGGAASTLKVKTGGDKILLTARDGGLEARSDPDGDGRFDTVVARGRATEPRGLDGGTGGFGGFFSGLASWKVAALILGAALLVVVILLIVVFSGKKAN